ncbi:MAG: Methylglyoxal reductase, dihydroxyacetone producing @ 2,5-didehydrogluconate reductase (2-dehydro-D-gluconate-forming) [uncultured Sphingomonadaceae bacterium]|uniref:Methylglyoxal reductase, dihydroxyacetone producing @ 2,5-didehydrogluconate reductase (2-dehydro-D-gluconate-forming) n=1 Tax=uncultured Sphingomonadaceae bacterium TaxID=169976 RepID=A0A6J4U560_9SPHN|nr:MAG: Methylglyoxal reductase, dihydroxyacetone producing @ 2,5-didehydrogluconate reductase (2-dehydro-D-gluconate-forming) [uncultured Sphingomonadaceae bacterium]
MTGPATITLNDGRAMPQLGQGVWQVSAEDTERLVRTAIDIGYRAVDTAPIYGNEAEVGAAVRASDETIFVTTKLWNTEHGRDAARRAFDASFDALGLDWIDLYLIHWSVPSRDLYVETWAALTELRDGERLRSIGVSNFTMPQLRRIIDATGVVPAANQIELHPAFPQNELVAFHREHGIATTSWSPLGQGGILGDPAIAAVAAKHGRTPAQIVIRWHVERGLVVIPKSSSAERLRENLAVTDFALDEEDMACIATLTRPDGRIGPDPDSM